MTNQQVKQCKIQVQKAIQVPHGSFRFLLFFLRDTYRNPPTHPHNKKRNNSRRVGEQLEMEEIPRSLLLPFFVEKVKQPRKQKNLVITQKGWGHIIQRGGSGSGGIFSLSFLWGGERKKKKKRCLECLALIMKFEFQFSLVKTFLLTHSMLLKCKHTHTRVIIFIPVTRISNSPHIIR